MNLRNLAKSSALYGIGGIAMRAVGMLMIPVYTRYLTRADYGILELVELVTTVVAITFGLMAVGNAMTRIYHDDKDPEWRASVISTAILGTGALVTSVSLIGACAAPLLGRVALGGEEFANLLRTTFASLVASMMMEVGLIYLRIKDRPLHFVLFSLAHLMVTLSLNILFIVMLHWGLWGFVLSKIITSGIGCAFLLTIVLRETGVRWNPEAARRMARFGGPLIFGGIAVFVVHFADRFFVRRSEGLAWVGIYALAYKFGFLISDIVGAPFARAWGANFYEMTGEKDWKSRFMEVLRGLYFVVMVAWTALAMLSSEVIELMTDREFHAAAAFIPLLALSYVARTVGDFFGDLLFIKKRSFTRAQIMTATAIANTALNLWLISRYGVWGAAWATFGTWMLFLAISWSRAMREFHFPVPYAALARLSLVAAAAFAASLLLRTGPLPVRILYKAALGVAALAVAWKMDYFTPGQRTAVRAAAARLRARLIPRGAG